MLFEIVDLALNSTKNMRFTLFGKKKLDPADARMHFEQDPAMVEELTRRVNEIAFRPSKGFLKDRAVTRIARPMRRETSG